MAISLGIYHNIAYFQTNPFMRYFPWLCYIIRWYLHLGHFGKCVNVGNIFQHGALGVWFPAISQPFPSHFPAICQPFASHFPAISQPFPSHFPAISSQMAHRNAPKATEHRFFFCGSRINAGLHWKVSSPPSAAHPWPGASLRSTWGNHRVDWCKLLMVVLNMDKSIWYVYNIYYVYIYIYIMCIYIYIIMYIYIYMYYVYIYIYYAYIYIYIMYIYIMYIYMCIMYIYIYISYVDMISPFLSRVLGATLSGRPLATRWMQRTPWGKGKTSMRCGRRENGSKPQTVSRFLEGSGYNSTVC